MSKILVLGRTMDMGGTEVAMAALLQKLVEKKEVSCRKLHNPPLRAQACASESP